MASTFKTFVSDDIVNTRTLLHEAIPITGSIVNGVTYDETTPAATNIKTYGHGMFQSVYDYPYQSSSANHIFDMTFGHDALITTQGTLNNSIDDLASTGGSLMPATADDLDKNALFSKRKNIYNQMAQVLVGHDVNGEIRQFDADGDLSAGDKYNALIFFNFARLLGKDELKKGTFSLKLDTTEAHGAVASSTTNITITDSGAESDYRTNSPAGEFAVLKVTASTGANNLTTSRTTPPCGLIFYQAGVIAITPELFNQYAAGHAVGYLTDADCIMKNGSTDVIYETMAKDTNDILATAIRQRIMNISFSNTTELNSTIYFCRVAHNDFNYSSNPTYLENSKIRVKNKSTDAPVSYITTVGLYSARNEMLAVAKLSEPLRKDPTNDMTLRVRLDY